MQVGNAGNAADTTGYGAVTNPFAIGKYDVTVGQYTSFLNAVGATDTYGLYNTGMATDLNVAGISQSGSSGSYTYSVIGSAYGTYDQGGDVFQWNDAVISGSSRGTRGGAWRNRANGLQFRDGNDPTLENVAVGFRLASVPEPTTMGLVLLVGAGLLLWKCRKVTL